MKIQKIGKTKWNDALNILTACHVWLSQQGMDHWEGAHTKDKVLDRIQHCEVFLIYEGKDAAGTITLSTDPPAYHITSDQQFWEEPESNAIYLSAMAVLPEHQGRGLAKRLLAFAEKRAQDKKVQFIRFDAVAHYKRLVNFYVKCGYKICGKRTTGKVTSYFFEKSL